MKPRQVLVIILLVIAACSSAENRGSSATWLLIVPPLTAAGDADTDAPLPKWQIVDSFAREIDCSSSMDRQRFLAHKQFGPIGNAQTYYEAFAVRILRGRCIASGDVRKGD